MTDDFTFKHLLDVPAMHAVERETWKSRNISEFLCSPTAMTIDAEIIEQAIDGLQPDLVQPRMWSKMVRTAQAYGLRNPVRKQVQFAQSAPKSVGLTRPHEEFFGELVNALGDLPATNVSGYRATRSYLQSTIINLSSWRPTGDSHESVPVFVHKIIPQSLISRSWFSNQGSPVLLQTDEVISLERAMVWWGVHNGTHADLIRHFKTDSPYQIEYGEGLLRAESLAVVAEVLASLETLCGAAAFNPRVLASGFKERLQRLSGAVESSKQAPAALPLESPFRFLPTIAHAYSTGACELIEAGFEVDWLPEKFRWAFQRRFALCRTTSGQVRGMLAKLGF